MILYTIFSIFFTFDLHTKACGMMVKKLAFWALTNERIGTQILNQVAPLNKDLVLHCSPLVNQHKVEMKFKRMLFGFML